MAPTPDNRPSLPELLVRWPAKLAEELLLAPWTVATVRRSLSELPQRIDVLSSDLTAFRRALEELLPELSGLVSGMDDRVGRVETVVAELGEVLTNLIGAIPGVRRALREPRPPGH